MINGNLTEFIDKLYLGEELLFEYAGIDYFLQGWSESDMNIMVLDRLTQPTVEGYIWQCSCATMRECAEKFLNEPLWGNDKFLNVHNDVIWKEF